MDLTSKPMYAHTTVGLNKLTGTRLTSGNLSGPSAVAQTGTGLIGQNYRALPGQILNAQSQQIGKIAGVRPNPLADVANWKTGGRQAPFNLPGSGDMTWWYIGGAVLLAAVLMRRKK